MPFDMKQIGHNIREARIDARMTQDELAAESNVSVDSVRKYEAGSTCPTLENAWAIACSLGVSIDDLCSLPAPSARPMMKSR